MHRPCCAHCAGSVCNAQFTPPARHDKTVLSVSCLLCRCELDDCSERVETSNFLSGDSVELSGIQFTPPTRTRHGQDSFVVSGVAVRCELASRQKYDSQQLSSSVASQPSITLLHMYTAGWH